MNQVNEFVASFAECIEICVQFATHAFVGSVMDLERSRSIARLALASL